MFTNKEISNRSIFTINALEGRALRVLNGELLLEDTLVGNTLTKLPFQKILALFIIGNITITTPLIEKCNQHGIPIVVMKSNLRTVLFFSITAEANFLLRKRQYEYTKDNLQIPKILVANKIQNQIRLLEKTRIKYGLIPLAKEKCNILLNTLIDSTSYESIMGIEGSASKYFFSSYFEKLDWQNRLPRTKIDPINATLDIGYTLLFNYIEAFTRFFGFDPYKGVYHQLWFKRKSLICDLVEPFRCIIDQQVRKAFNRKQCKPDDFNFTKNQYVLKYYKSKEYHKMFFEKLVDEKMNIFKYIQNFYRAFMQQKHQNFIQNF